MGDWTTLALQPGEPDYLLLGPWQRFDALWYLKIARDGYTSPDTIAFFPLLPLAIKLASLTLGGNLTLGGLAVTTLSFVTALVLLRRLVTREYGDAVAGRTLTYLVCFPTAFFFLAPFTESLFLLTAVAAFYGARSGRWWLAGCAGLLAGLARAQGLFLVLPLLYESVRQSRSLGLNRPWHYPLALLPAIGWLGFNAYAGWVSGGELPFQALQVWGYRLEAPWQVVAASWQHVVTQGDVSEALNLASLIAFTLATCVGLWRLPFAFSLYVAPQLGLLATREMWFSPLMSTSRYVLVLFPVFILLARYVERPALRQSIEITGLLLQALFWYHFVHWGFVA